MCIITMNIQTMFGFLKKNGKNKEKKYVHVVETAFSVKKCDRIHFLLLQRASGPVQIIILQRDFRQRPPHFPIFKEVLFFFLILTKLKRIFPNIPISFVCGRNNVIFLVFSISVFVGKFIFFN